jgi:hypothetical protein
MQEETPLFTSDGTVHDVEHEYSSNNEVILYINIIKNTLNAINQMIYTKY